MAKKSSRYSVKKNSQEENSFLVQTNIDDLLKAQDVPEESEVDNVVSVDKEDSKIQEPIQENKEVNVEKIVEKQNKKEESASDNSEEILKQQKKKLDEMEQSVSKKNNKKSRIINLVFFFVNIAVVAGILVYQLLNEDFVPITGLRIDVLSLFICVLLFGGSVLCEVGVFSYLLKQSTGKWQFGTAYKVNEIGRYYDAVTPMATGGQAFQVTYLKARGIPLHTSLSIPMAKYVFGQIAWVLISLVCLIISFVDKSYGNFVSIMSVIGFILGSVVLFLTVFLSVCKKIGKKIVVKVLKFLYKIKIIKNYEKQYEKITKYISDFQDVMKQYAKSPKDFIIMLVLSLGKNILNYCIPFFVVRLFSPGTEGALFFRLFVMTILVDMSASFFPLPGGSGLNEVSFMTAFGLVVGQNNILVWVLFIWRFFSYYIYLLQGVCILCYDMAYGNKKYRWQVRRDNLVEESMVFKQNQINKFRAERAKRRKNKQKKSGLKEYL